MNKMRRPELALAAFLAACANSAAKLPGPTPTEIATAVNDRPAVTATVGPVEKPTNTSNPPTRTPETPKATTTPSVFEGIGGPVNPEMVKLEEQLWAYIKKDLVPKGILNAKVVAKETQDPKHMFLYIQYVDNRGQIQYQIAPSWSDDGRLGGYTPQKPEVFAGQMPESLPVNFGNPDELKITFAGLKKVPGQDDLVPSYNIRRNNREILSGNVWVPDVAPTVAAPPTPRATATVEKAQPTVVAQATPEATRVTENGNVKDIVARMAVIDAQKNPEKIAALSAEVAVEAWLQGKIVPGATQGIVDADPTKFVDRIVNFGEEVTFDAKMGNNTAIRSTYRPAVLLGINKEGSLVSSVLLGVIRTGNGNKPVVLQLNLADAENIGFFKTESGLGNRQITGDKVEFSAVASGDIGKLAIDYFSVYMNLDVILDNFKSRTQGVSVPNYRDLLPGKSDDYYKFAEITYVTQFGSKGDTSIDFIQKLASKRLSDYQANILLDRYLKGLDDLPPKVVAGSFPGVYSVSSQNILVSR